MSLADDRARLAQLIYEQRLTNETTRAGRTEEEWTRATDFQAGAVISEGRGPASLFKLALTLDVLGDLDDAAVEEALARLVRRHAALRTELRVDTEGVWQKVLRDGVAGYAHHHHGDAGSAEAEIRSIMAAPHRFDDLPVLQVRRISGGAVDRVVVWCHHAFLDGWSMARLMQEFLAILQGRDLPAPPRVTTQDLDLSPPSDAGMAWWRGHLAELTHLDLPELFGSAEAEQDSVIDVWPADLQERMRDAAHRHGRSQAALFDLACRIAIARRTGACDLVVLTPVARRDTPRTAELVAHLTNILPVRMRLRPDAPADALMEAHARVWRTIMAHGDVTLQALHAALDWRDRPGRVIVAWQDYPIGDAGPDAPVRVRDSDSAVVPADLGIFAYPAPGGLRIRLDGRFAVRRAAETLAADIRTALENLLEGDGAAISPDAASVQMGEALARRHATMLDRFEHVCAARAVQNAVEGDAGALTYADLEALSARIAGGLQSIGLMPGEPVGWAFRRSPEAIASMFGILRAGGVWLALCDDDPDPAQRAKLRRAEARFVLTDDPARDYAAQAGEVAFLTPDALPAGAYRRPHLNPASPMMLSATSGTTGRPRLVPFTHGGVLSLADSAFFLHQADPLRVLNHARPDFDASVTEIWAPIMLGGTVVLSAPGRFDPDRIAREIARVNTLWITAGAFKVVAMRTPGAFTHLAACITGGDVVDPVAASRVIEAGCRMLVNGYGPTEATTFCSAYRIEEPVATGDLPIGRALPENNLYILDDAGRPVPQGAVGELFVGGRGVALGYLGEPERTAEKFLSDPFAPEPGARMYRTGDFVRLDANGQIRFLGRRDDQVKLHGFRVERVDVEARIAAMAGVARAAVAVDRTGTAPVLRAWIVPNPEAKADAIRRRIRGDLPGYMVPVSIAFLEDLPLGGTGKVDRKALVALPRTGGAAETSTDMRTALVQAEMCALLGTEAVGPEDDFFAIGGHSLLALQLSARLSAAFERQVPLQAVFANPTPTALARIEGAAPRPVLPVTGRREGPATAAQRRLMMASDRSSKAAYQVQVCARMGAGWTAERVGEAWRVVTARHAGLRSTFFWDGGKARQRVEDVAPPVLRRATPLARDGLAAWREEIGLLDACGAVPPIRLAVAPAATGGLWVMLACHHIMLDLVGMQIFWGDLVAEIAGRALPPAPKGTLVDLALAAPSDPPDEAWWRARLKDVPVPLADTPTPADPVEGAGRVLQELGGATWRGLQDAARARAMTPFMAALAAFARALNRVGAAPDILVNVVMDQRSALGLEEIVGFQSNLVPVIVQAPQEDAPDAWLDAARRAVLEVLPHAEAGIDRIAAATGCALGEAPMLALEIEIETPSGGETPAILEDAFDPCPPRFPKVPLAVNVRLSMARVHMDLEFDRRRLTSPLAEAVAVELAQSMAWLGGTSAGAGPESLVEGARATTGGRLRDLQLGSLEAEGARIDSDRIERAVHALADRLRQAGLRPGDTLAVAGEAGPDWVRAVLAAWRLHLAVLPLGEETAPPRSMPCRAVWRDGRLQHRASGGGGPAGAWWAQSAGTTGRPRLALLSEANLSHFAAAAGARYGIRSDDRVLIQAAPTFDICLEELLLALSSGATLVAAPPGLRRRPDEMLAFAAAQGITVLDLPTATFGALMARPETARAFAALPGLRRVIVGGETLRPWAIRNWIATAPSAALFNSYGPAETTIVATAAEITAPSDTHVGTALPGVDLAVCDASGGPVPRGVPGEICIGGAGLGQLHPPDPARLAHPGHRPMFRTGDLGQLDADGRLHVLGRLGRSRKLGGVWIDIEDVETALERCPGVAGAIVPDVQDGPFEVWVTRDAHRPEVDPSAALAALGRRAPTRVYLLNRLPATAIGKKDRRAPRPEGAQLWRPDAGPGAEDCPVRAAFADVLGLPEDILGEDADFFALGGYSLQLIELAALLRERTGKRLRHASFFETPTIAGIRALLVEPQAASVARPAEGALPLLAVQRHVLQIERAARAPLYSTVQAVILNRHVAPEALRAALRRVSAETEALRLAMSEDGARVTAADDVPIRVQDLTGLQPPDREKALAGLARIEGMMPVDLTAPPHLAATLAVLEPDRVWLLLRSHHAVLDDWSWQALWRRLGIAFEGAPPEEAGCYAGWLAARKEASPPAAWWVSQIRDVAPMRLPRGAGHTESPRFVVSDEAVARLRRAAADRRASVFQCVAEAAVSASAPWMTGPHLIGITVDPRTVTDAEPVIGGFSDVMPLRVEVGTDVAAGLREAVARGAHGVNRLMAEMDPDGRVAMAEAMTRSLVLTHLRSRIAEHTDWTPWEVPMRGGTSAHALTITVLEQAERLEIVLTRRDGHLDPEALEQWCERFRAELQRLCGGC